MIEQDFDLSFGHCLKDVSKQRKDFLILLSEKGKGEMEISFARWISFREIGRNGFLDGCKLLQGALWKKQCIKESHGESIL